MIKCFRCGKLNQTYETVMRVYPPLCRACYDDIFLPHQQPKRDEPSLLVILGGMAVTAFALLILYFGGIF